MPLEIVRHARVRLGSIEDQVSVDAFDLLQMAKRIGPQCEAAEHEDLSGEKSLTLDGVVVD